MATEIHEEPIGETSKGKEIRAYTLINNVGLRATFLDFGGILVELEVPDRLGIPDDLTLGFDDIGEYTENNSAYFGALVGPFANRIADSKFELDGEEYELDENEGDHHLHGGSTGLSLKSWKGKVVKGDTGEELQLKVKHKDGEGGYPGSLDVTVRISLNEKNGLVYEWEAKSSKDTVVNFTAHPYFNLISQDNGSIRSHHIQIHADKYVANDEEGIPTGKLNKVNDGPFDFRESQVLDPRLDSPDPQVFQHGGFDHTFVLKEDRDPENDPVAVFTEESTGRRMEIFTTEPGGHLYTGNSLDGTIEGKNGFPYEKHSGFCFETQHFPDSPNHPDFPSTVLKAGDTYTSRTEYRFSKLD